MMNINKPVATPVITKALTRVIRMPELVHLVGMSRSSIYNRLNPKSKFYDPQFPRPVKLGSSSAIGWLLSSVLEWIYSLSPSPISGE